MVLRTQTILFSVLCAVSFLAPCAAEAQKAVSGKFTTSVTLVGQELGGFNVSAIVEPTRSTPTPIKEEEYVPATGQNLQETQSSPIAQTSQQTSPGSTYSKSFIPRVTQQSAQVLDQPVSNTLASQAVGASQSQLLIQTSSNSLQGLRRSFPDVEEKLDRYSREIDAALSVNKTPSTSADLVKDGVRNLFAEIIKNGATSSAENKDVKEASDYLRQTIKDQLKPPAADTISFLVRQAEASVSSH